MAEQTNDEKILDNALAPKRAAGDSGSVEQHSIPDQIAADKHNAAKAASRAGGWGGFRAVKFVPPSSAE